MAMEICGLCETGMHSMEVRADWPVHTWHNEAVWFHYTVETLPAVTVEAGVIYALEI